MNDPSIVSMKHLECYEDEERLVSCLRELIQLAGGIQLESGESVAIKINMCDARPPETGAITHPRFLCAFLRYLRESFEDLKIYVVESDATVVLADQFINWFQYMPALERWGAVWWNLSKDEIVEMDINGHHLKKVPVPSLITSSKLISLSKLKTNSLSKITCGLKNQFGCLPMRQKSVFHDNLAEVIVDANLAMTPVFCIVDGIIGMGGPSGPSFGVPICSQVVLAGSDPVAVDTASARLMGYNPSGVKHIRLAARSGLGSTEYTLVGDPVESIDFEIDRLANLQGMIGREIKKIMRLNSRSRWKRAK